jgi:DNA polymerase-3 subunit epsilon
MIGWQYQWLEFRRKYVLRRLCQQHPERAEQLHTYLNTPLPAPNTPLHNVGLLAVDLETNGLNPNRDDILSIGFVAIDASAIKLATAKHLLIKPRTDINASGAIIHKIFDDRAATGVPLCEALPLLLNALAGRVLLAHYASIERRFLRVACRACFGVPLLVQTVDTLELEKRHLLRQQGAISQDHLHADALRLANVRRRYKLPDAPNHDALEDALATAELFWALADHQQLTSLQNAMN